MNLGYLGVNLGKKRINLTKNGEPVLVMDNWDCEQVDVHHML